MNNGLNKNYFNNCVANEWNGVIKGWLMNQFWAVWIYGDILECHFDVMDNRVNMKDLNRCVADKWDKVIKFGLWTKFWVVWYNFS